jgi:hypothetical protein
MARQTDLRGNPPSSCSCWLNDAPFRYAIRSIQSDVWAGWSRSDILLSYIVSGLAAGRLGRGVLGSQIET